MATQITLSGGAFQDAQGNVLANGTLVLRLTSDVVTTDAVPEKQILGNIPITITLDANGNVSGTPKIWSNAELSPSGTGYSVLAFSAAGAPSWKTSQTWVFNQAGGSTVDLGTMVPTSTGVSYANAVVTNPSADQVITTNSLVPANGNTTQRLGSTAARWVGLFNAITASALNGYILVDGNNYALTPAGIQAALNQAASNGGGTVILPPGTIEMGSTGITIASGVGLVGAGMNQTILHWTSGINAIGMTSPVGCVVRDLAIKFANSLAGVGLRITASDASPAFNNIFQNILIDYNTLGAVGSCGIFVTTSGPSNTDFVLNRIDNIVIQTADIAVKADGCEGNHWDVTAQNIGVTVGQTMFQLTGFNADEVGDLRLETGSGNAANIVGLSVTGNNNMFRLVVDGLASTTALNDTGGYNIYDITTIGLISSLGTVPTTSSYRWASGNQAKNQLATIKITATNGDSGITPTITANALLGNVNQNLGSGTGKVYGVIGVARGSADVVGDRAYGGWFKATAGSNTSTEVGLHAESNDASGTAAEFGAAGVVKTSISGTGAIEIDGATPTGSGTQLGIGNTAGFGNGAAATAVTTTLKGTGSGPAAPQTFVKYLQVDIGGTKFWVPLVQ